MKTFLPFYAARLAGALLAVSALIGPAARGQSWQWAAAAVAQPGGSGYTNGYAAVGTDAAGNTYVTGRFDGTLTLGGFTLTSGPAVDMFLARLNPAGVFTLAVRVPASVLITPRALALAPDGTVVVAGGLIGSATFGPAGPTLTSAGGTDIFVARFGPATGTWTQASRAGGPANDGVLALAVAPDGLISLTGGCGADCAFGTLPLPPNQGSADVYVAQLDAAGTWQRVATGGGPGFDYGTAVAVAASGEVVVAANLSSAAATFGAEPALSLPGGNDVAVARFSPGSGQWTQAVAGGAGGFEDASGVAVAPDGTVTVAGVFVAATQFGALPALGTGGDADAYVARLSAAGTWTQLVRAGGPGNEQVAAVKVAADGTATVGGTFEATAAFGGLPALVSAGQADVFVARLDPAGTWQQALAGGGAGNEQATALSLQGSSATVVGAFGGSATFGPHTVAGSGFTDTFAARFAGFPDLVVSTTLPGGGGEYNNVTITGTGALFLTTDLIVHGTLTVQPNGSLATTAGSGCTIISGPGNFRLEDRAVFGICSPQGITTGGPTGSVQVLGSRYYDGGATYVYNGPAAQVTGNGLPGTTRNVTSSSGIPGLSLSQGLAITELLYASSDVLLGGQPLVLRADASGTALVANVNGGRVLGNTAVVQRFITNPYLGVGYRHYAAPVQNAAVADLATPNFTPEVSQGAAYNASRAPGLIRPFPTVYRYDESRVANAAITGFPVFDRGWAALTAPADRLLPGLGYTVHLPGTALVSFRGTLTEGNVQFNFARGSSADGGWYLVGNPYPSPLDASTFTLGVVPFQTLENLGAAIYQFRSTGPYAGVYTAIVAGLGGSPMIPAGQAFFMRSTQGPGGARAAINLTNSNRRTFFSAVDNTFARPAADPRPRLTLSLRGSTGPADPTIVYFDAAATAAFDPAADARKLPNVGNLPNLSTALGPDRYAINGLPPLTGTRVVPLLVNVPAPGSYTLSADELLHFAPGQTVFLTDAVANTRLALTPTATYTFSVATAGEQPGRFALVFGPATGPLTAATTRAAARLALAPNPAHTAVILTLPATSTPQPVTVLDGLGRSVQRALAPANASTLTLDVSALPPGVYVLRCGASSARLVVE